MNRNADKFIKKTSFTDRFSEVMKLDYGQFFNWLYTNNLYKNVPLDIVKNKLIPLTIGNEIIFDSKDNKVVDFLNKWSIQTKLHEKCQLILSNVFWYGKSVAFLLKNKEFTDLYVADYNLMSNVAKVNENEKLAVIYTNFNKSDTSSLSKIVIKENKITIQKMGQIETIRATSESETKKEYVPIGGVIAGELDTPYFPVKEFIDVYLPFSGMMNNSLFSGLPIYWSSRKLVVDINDLFEQKSKERLKNQTRIIASLEPDRMASIQNGVVDAQSMLDDLILTANTQGYNVGGGNAIVTVQGDPKLDQYNNDLVFTLTSFYESCGYNYSNYEGEQYTNKTQSIMNNDLDTTTSGLRQKWLKSGLEQLINCVLAEAGLEPFVDGRANYEIKFGKKSVVEKISQLELVKAKLDMGLTSRESILIELDDISASMAKEKIEAADLDLISRKAINAEFEQNDNNDNDEEVEDDNSKEVI